MSKRATLRDTAGASVALRSRPDNKLSWYTQPPEEDVTLEDFEDFAVRRLRGACVSARVRSACGAPRAVLPFCRGAAQHADNAWLPRRRSVERYRDPPGSWGQPGGAESACPRVCGLRSGSARPSV